MFKPQSINEY